MGEIRCCEDCIHIEMCAMCVPPLPVCDSFKDIKNWVEVVRCKDCASGKGSTYRVCPLYRDGLMKDEDFCSKGERKDND